MQIIFIPVEELFVWFDFFLIFFIHVLIKQKYFESILCYTLKNPTYKNYECANNDLRSTFYLCV